MRQLHEQLVQHGEPADAGVEHADRAPAQLLGDLRLRRRHAASLARRAGERPARALADAPAAGAAVVARGHGVAATLRARGSASPSPTPSIAPLSFLTTASAIPVSENPPLALTTPARITATSRISPTYSTVPCPRSSPALAPARACARPMQLVPHLDLPVAPSRLPRDPALSTARGGAATQSPAARVTDLRAFVTSLCATSVT